MNKFGSLKEAFYFYTDSSKPIVSTGEMFLVNGKKYEITYICWSGISGTCACINHPIIQATPYGEIHGEINYNDV